MYENHLPQGSVALKEKLFPVYGREHSQNSLSIPWLENIFCLIATFDSYMGVVKIHWKSRAVRNVVILLC